MPFIRTVNRIFCEASCPNCGATQLVPRDEDGDGEMELFHRNGTDYCAQCLPKDDHESRISR